MTENQPFAALEVVVMAPSDSRRMCHEQGKSCIHALDEDSDILITEAVNGVIEVHRLSTGAITRLWPDGRVESYREGDPEIQAPSYVERDVEIAADAAGVVEIRRISTGVVTRIRADGRVEQGGD